VKLKGIKKGDHPKKLFLELSEELLEVFKSTKLLDPYDLYQHLMSYWAEVMQDDIFMIVSDGWKEAAKPRQIIEATDKKNKEKPDFTVGRLKFKAELIPPSLIVSQFLKAEKTAIEKLEAEVATLEQKQDELKEEHGGEEGLLSEVIDNDKVKKSEVIARLRDIKGDKDFSDERKVLEEWLGIAESAADGRFHLS
jgi:type I restriction enzyme M protein